MGCYCFFSSQSSSVPKHCKLVFLISVSRRNNTMIQFTHTVLINVVFILLAYKVNYFVSAAILADLREDRLLLITERRFSRSSA
jgi:hypothetical protein